jgi:hypothetical protein
MRRLAIILMLAVALDAQTLTKQQKIERIIELTQGTTTVDMAVKQVRDVLEQAQPRPTAKQLEKREDALKKIEKLVRERMQKVRPEFVRIYNEAFTDPEIDGMLAFYESPAGKAVNQKLPAVSARLSGMVQTQIDTLSSEINKIAEETLK